MAGMLAHCPQMKVAHVNSQTWLCRELSVTFFTTKHSLLLFMFNLEDKKTAITLTALEIVVVCTWTWFSSWSGFLKAWSHRVQGNCGGPCDQLCLVSSRLWWNIRGHSVHCNVGSSCITATWRCRLPIWVNTFPQWPQGKSLIGTWK